MRFFFNIFIFVVEHILFQKPMTRVKVITIWSYYANANAAIEVEEDELNEIDTKNILPGSRRTRGKQIDFTKAAASAQDEDDDEDDGDFEEPAAAHTATDEDEKMEQ